MQNRPTRRSVLAGSASLLLAPHLLRADSPAATRPARAPGTRKDIPPRMSYLANGQVKVGIDLALGGAITYLAPAGEPDKNVVNGWDLGRQIQMSYYAGPVPYTVEGHAGPPPAWRHIGWNPIQVGDDYGNPSKVIEHERTDSVLRTRCVPMQWPLDDVPGECTFESLIQLDGPSVLVTATLKMDRADKTQWPARTQEMPAVYANGPWHRLFTYAGDKPFQNGDLQRIEHDFTPDSPWANWQATENWAALVDDKDWGLGVWNPGCVSFSGGFAGKPGAGGPKDSPTSYIAPNRQEILDHDIVHKYAYALVLGDLKSIRQWVYDKRHVLGSQVRPAWTFEDNRHGWHYRNATDAGWPIKGSLDVDLSGKNPQIVSPGDTWQAADAPRLVVEAAFTGPMKQAAVYWATAADAGFSPKRVALMDVLGDGEMRAYAADLSKSESYRGLITQVRIDPLSCGHAGDKVVIKRVVLEKA
jgi:hypothetical protein